VILCKICNTRRPRRHCPGVEGDICNICCGTEREVTVSCPFGCEFLREARLHEQPTPFTDEYPNKDIRITDEFLERNRGLLIFLPISLATACQVRPDIIDFDIREGLEALIKTYRTLESGLVYETRPNNPLAAYVYEKVQESIARYRQALEEKTGVPMRDTDILGVLVFMQRMEMRHNNGRRKGRAFIYMLNSSPVPPEQKEPIVQL
jgi:hypothetical protein